MKRKYMTLLILITSIFGLWITIDLLSPRKVKTLENQVFSSGDVKVQSMKIAEKHEPPKEEDKPKVQTLTEKPKQETKPETKKVTKDPNVEKKSEKEPSKQEENKEKKIKADKDKNAKPNVEEKRDEIMDVGNKPDDKKKESVKPKQNETKSKKETPTVEAPVDQKQEKPKDEAKPATTTEKNKPKPTETNQEKPAETNQAKPAETNQGKPAETNQAKPGEINQAKPAETNQAKPTEDINAGKRDKINENTDLIVPPVPRPICGSICSYDGKGENTEYYPFIKKDMKCEDLLIRGLDVATVKDGEPPHAIPETLYDAFTQFGQLPSKSNIFLNGETKDLLKGSVENLIQKDKEGKNVNVHMDSGDFKQVILEHKTAVAGKNGFVVGIDQVPWLEAILLNMGAKSLIASGIQTFDFEDSKIKIWRFSKLITKFIRKEIDQFDFAASYSWVEHYGLGRYGEPLNPYGDFEIVAQTWCMVRPGALFFLAVPAVEEGKGYIEWNAHRVYGKERLQHLTVNWKVLYMKYSTGHVLLVLQKPME